MVLSLSAWPGSARLLRETGLLDQLLQIHASGEAGDTPLVYAARGVLVRMGLHDAESAKRIRDEILSKISFVLPRHQSLGVRSLLEQDVSLLASLCLHDDAEESDKEEGVATAVATCWRIHVGLVLKILRQMPMVADESVAMMNHVAMPCLMVVTELCLGGGIYPAFREEEEEEENVNRDNTSAGIGASASSLSGEELVRASGGRVEDVILCEVLRASADSAATGGGRGGGGRSGGVEWITPAQARRTRQSGAAGTVPTLGEQRISSAGSLTWGEGWGADGAAGPSRCSARFLPGHWLLRLMVSRQSPALRKHAGTVLGSLASTNGPGTSKEVAEVAAHLFGVVVAKGSEAAGMQVLTLNGGHMILCVFLRRQVVVSVRRDSMKTDRGRGPAGLQRGGNREGVADSRCTSRVSHS